MSHSTHGFISVISAIIGNTIVTVLKFIGFFMTGSGAMFSEAIHSLADTSNQALLLVGIKKSRKKADYYFDYGYGKERFFWAILSACGIFFIGAGVTVYHGIETLLNPGHVEKSIIVYIILIISLIVEGITLLIAIKSIYKKDLGFLESIKHSDNASKAVILEDSVAVFGITVALISVFLTYLTGKVYFDSIGSIIIGILLGVVAIILIIENKNYLLGKSMDEDLKEEIIELIEKDPMIEKVLRFKSIILDIDSYLIKFEAEFNGTALMREINNNGYFQDEYEYIKDDYNDFLKFCVDYADRLPRIMGKRIDDLEKTLINKFPSIKHIDIELN